MQEQIAVRYCMHHSMQAYAIRMLMLNKALFRLVHTMPPPNGFSESSSCMMGQHKDNPYLLCAFKLEAVSNLQMPSSSETKKTLKQEARFLACRVAQGAHTC